MFPNRIRLAGMLTVGLAFAASGLHAQFSTISSRAAMSANDSLTWNQLGSNGASVPLPASATSNRGVQVTIGPADSSASVSISSVQLPEGFAIDDVYISSPSRPVTLTFNPPVVAVGLNAAVRASIFPYGFSMRVSAFNGATPLGSLEKTANYTAREAGTAPFFGVRDERGITSITIEALGCQGLCYATYYNQLSLITPQRVSVDVKPGADKSVLVADSNAKLPLAILSAAGFDASTEVDTASLTFGRAGSEASILSCAGADVNGDLRLDLSCQFSVRSGAFVAGDLTAKLKGKLLNGTPIFGTADVIVK